MTDLLSKARLDEIMRRCDAATPGPWTRDRNWSITGPAHDWDHRWNPGGDNSKRDRTRDQVVCYVNGPGETNRDRADHDFIAAARQDIPDLMADNAELRARLNELREAVDEASIRIKISDLSPDLQRQVRETFGE